MSYHELIQIEIRCDFPGCDEYLLFGHEEWEKISKMIKAIGWTSISFPGGASDLVDESLDFCSECKNKDVLSIEDHNCIYMRKTKGGKPSYLGSILECYFCGKLKI